jgi:hypothetical protein
LFVNFDVIGVVFYVYLYVYCGGWVNVCNQFIILEIWICHRGMKIGVWLKVTDLEIIKNTDYCEIE